MQLRLKVEEANSLAVENASLRHKVELLERREKVLVELFKKMKVPLVVIDEEKFEDVELSE
jgi:hypothetical protein